MRILLMILMFTVSLMLFGCSQNEEKETPAQTAVPVEKPVAVEKAEQVVQQTREKVAEVAEEAQETVAQVTNQAQNLLPTGLALPSANTGETVYTKSCSSCHKLGIIGAPKTGDKVAWQPLISHGTETLVKNAIEGIGKMPARGGNSKLTDAEVRAAVEYMLEQSR
ncbi:MAG: cytochrome c5 family protein [Desulfuromonadales bacterium]|nr:cytochrome c5 family protein [Desulfuromonadales bacterium]MBN2792560.1 cytochrome c5 family protein [Desulfuromonadales bacterium]